MIHQLSLTLAPEQAYDEAVFREQALNALRLPADSPAVVRKRRQSVDARGRQIRIHVEADVFVGESPSPLIQYQKPQRDVSRAPAAIVVGAGPAGLRNA